MISQKYKTNKQKGSCQQIGLMEKKFYKRRHLF